MTNTQQLEMVKEYLMENVDALRMIVSELNSWNGCLDHLEVYENDEEFFNTFFANKPMDAVRAAQYGEYNYADEYVRFNAYGNLESFDEWELERELKSNIDDIINEIINNKDEIEIPEEIKEMI